MLLNLSVITISLAVIAFTYSGLWILLSVAYLRKSALDSPPVRYNHKVSVLLPARNEQRVICNVIRDLDKQTFRNISVSVIAHNCTDKTYEVSLDTKNQVNIPVTVYRLLTKETGKGIGLQFGLDHADGDLVVYFDSDSGISPDYIEKLVGWIDAGYCAVQGNILAKNPAKNRLTFFQHLENLVFMRIFWGGKFRMGLSAGLGGTGVMVKKEILQKIHGYKNVLIEDFELFLRLTILGYSVAFAEDAFVYDEKVPTFSALIRQRSRWFAGHLQLIGSLKYFKVIGKNPIDFLQLMNPIYMFALLVSLIIVVLRFSLAITYWSVPLSIWVVITVVQNLLFVEVLRKQGFGRVRAIYSVGLLCAFCCHWYLVAIKSFFIHGWTDTKTEHFGGVAN